MVRREKEAAQVLSEYLYWFINTSLKKKKMERVNTFSFHATLENREGIEEYRI